VPELVSMLSLIIDDRLQAAAFKLGLQLGNEWRDLVNSLIGGSPAEFALDDRIASLVRDDPTLVKLQFVDCDDCGHMIGEAITAGDPTQSQAIERIRRSAIVSCYFKQPLCASCSQRRYSRDIANWVNTQILNGNHLPEDGVIIKAARRVSEVCFQVTGS